MATKANRRVWAETPDGGWVRGVLLRVVKRSDSQKDQLVVRTDAGKEMKVGNIVPMSHVRERRRVGNVGSMKAEKLPTRLGRFRRRVSVVPVRHVPGQQQVYGDYFKMLNQKVKVDGTFLKVYGNAIMAFNDSHDCFLQYLNHKDSSGPTGGNAIARPWQVLGDSVAVPTGPYTSLDEVMLCWLPGNEELAQHTAKEVIDAGIKAIVMLFLSRPDKDTLYYAVNATEPEGVDRIGLDIFAGVGKDVRDYITVELKKVPEYVQALR